MRSWKLVTLSLVGLLVAGLAAAGLFDLAGEWNLSMQIAIGAPGLGDGGICQYSGSTEVAQDGTALSGVAAYVLDDGVTGCPPEVSASYTGALTPEGVEMGALMGQLGTATFEGSISIPLGGDGLGVDGDVTVTGGPFAGSTGIWSASRISPDVDIPTLGTVGAAALALLLVAGGLLALRRSAA